MDEELMMVVIVVASLFNLIKIEIRALCLSVHQYSFAIHRKDFYIWDLQIDSIMTLCFIELWGDGEWTNWTYVKLFKKNVIINIDVNFIFFETRLSTWNISL